MTPLRGGQPQKLNQSAALSAGVMLCGCIALGHLYSLYKSSIKKVIPFNAAVEGVAPVGFVQLVKLLWLLIMLLHGIPGLEDLVPLLSGK